MAIKRKKKNNFIDNKEFYSAMVNYRQQCQRAKEQGDPKPLIPRYIGKCFLDIAEHLSIIIISDEYQLWFNQLRKGKGTTLLIIKSSIQQW